MPAKERMIKVLANPWHAIDSDGVPQAVVQLPGTRDRFVGAFLDHTKSAAEDRACFYFTGDVVSLPLSAETARAVLDRSLIAADEATAKACGIKFIEPVAVLATEKASAIAQYQAAYGADSKLSDPPAPPSANSDDVAAPAAPEIAKGRKVSPNVALRAPSEA